MLRRNDGSVYSENTPSSDFNQQPRFHGVQRVILTTIKYIDDARNIYGKTQNPQVVYEGIVVGGKSEGQNVSNIRDGLGQSGEFDNYSERIYKVCTKPLSGKKAVPLNKQDGAIVYVVFLDGNSAFPIIVGRDKASLDKSRTGAKKSDGPRRRWQYNGLYYEVNKSGELTVRRKGGTYKAKENVFVQNETGDEVTLQWTKNKMKLTVGRDVITEIRDGATEKTTLQFKSGLLVTIDGKNDVVKIDTAGGSHAYVDGKSGTIELKDNGTGKLKITGDKVALGAASAELLAQISASLAAIISQANTEAGHTHIGNLGYPTAPPSSAGAWSGLASALGAIKGLVDGIKGTL